MRGALVLFRKPTYTHWYDIVRVCYRCFVIG